MLSIDQFLRLIDRYSRATGLAEATIATRLLNDGKGIERLRSGRDIGARKLEDVVRRLSDEWPDGAGWPAGIPRPGRSKSRNKGACHVA